MAIQLLTTSIVTNEAERLEAIDYIDSKLRKAFKCDPPPTKGIICIAHLKGSIAASLVLQGTRFNQPFVLEEHYDFNSKDTHFPFCRAHIMQATRWTSSHRSASLLLIHDCAVLAREAGKEYMLMEAKESAVDRIREIGMCCEAIPGALLNLQKVREQVGENGMAYYLEYPIPTLYMLPIELMISACKEQIDKVRTE